VRSAVSMPASTPRW